MTKKLFPDQNVMKTKYFCVNQDWEVPIPGFFIIAPNRKIKSVTDMTDEESLEFMKILRETRNGMREALKIKEVYLFQNEDSIFGFHFWILPKREWMDKFRKESSEGLLDFIAIMNYAKENMATDEIIEEVKAHVEKMKKYMKGVK